ncbi:MAG: ArsR/SmtB family transcription factor [Armatimonadota bacterium]
MIGEYAAALRAASDPSRVRILKLLQRAELCVCQLRRVLGLSQSTVSRHLAVLREAGFVERCIRGRWAFYRLAESSRNRYASALASLIMGWLDEDQVVRADCEQLERVLQTGAERMCKGGERRGSE